MRLSPSVRSHRMAGAIGCRVGSDDAGGVRHFSANTFSMRRSRLLPLVLFLALPAVTAAPHATAAKSRDCLSSVHGVDLQRSTVLDMQRAMAAHRLTSVDLVTAYLKRIKTFDHGPGELNAIRVLNPH